MSLAAGLKSLIEQKKKQGGATSAAAPENKYKTRAEIEAEKRRQRQLEKEQKSKGKERDDSTSDSSNNSSNSNSNSDNKDNNNNSASSEQVDKKDEFDSFLELSQIKPATPKDEVFRRLKKLKEPVTLFGETDIQRERRLLQLEVNAPVDSEYKFGSSDQFGLDLKILDKAEKESSGNVGDASASRIPGMSGSAEDELGEEEGLALKALENLEGVVELSKEEDILLLFWKLLKEWEAELNDRPEAVKRTAQGKVATATYKQTVRNIRPLFKLLQKKALARDILQPLDEIARFMKMREYVKANDAYLRMAIGNAPWPMGVTMVGIHERSAREKIFSNQVAHILNDETQRKYIQAVKRLMSFSQARYPNDPSKNIG